MLNALASQSVLVLGLGDSGLAMADWCARNGAAVRVDGGVVRSMV